MFRFQDHKYTIMICMYLVQDCQVSFASYVPLAGVVMLMFGSASHAIVPLVIVKYLYSITSDAGRFTVTADGHYQLLTTPRNDR